MSFVNAKWIQCAILRGLELCWGAAADVGFSGDVGEGEADPEGGAEELMGLKVGEGRGCEEDSYYRAGGCYAEEDGEGAGHPLAVEWRVVAEPEDEGAYQGVEKEDVEEENGSDLVESSDGMGVHDEGCDSGGGSEDEECDCDAAMGCSVAAYLWREPEWEQQDEAHRWEDVGEGHGAVGGKDVVELVGSGKSCLSWGRKEGGCSDQYCRYRDDAQEDKGDPGESSRLWRRNGGCC